MIVQAGMDINERLYLKIPKAERAMGMVQVVEHLLSNCKASTTKKKINK
jgi:hypothetical protein